MAAGCRVLMTADAVGGVWQDALELGQALAAEGAEPLIALLGPAPSPAQRADAGRLAGVRLIETGLPLDWLCNGPEPVLAAGRAIAKLARETRAELVQLNMPTLAAAGFDCPTVAVTHGRVATWWEAAHPETPLAPQYGWHRPLMREGLAAADLVIAPSAAYAATVRRHYALSRLPAVVHNGRTPAALPPAAIHDCALTVGRLWDRVKGATLLDRVAARLAARPIFVSAAALEPFGLAVLEAASTGCALVLSDIATSRELWDGAAVFVPDGDEAYRRLGATRFAAIYNALDPDTHHPVAADPDFDCDLAFLGNRLPDREARVDEFFLKPAAALSDRSFLIGGSGWDDKVMPPNVRQRGHVGTGEHNAFNCTPRAVLNVARDSMARVGFSPATRVFEAAGAGACLITDAWEDVEMFLKPGEEVLVARDGKDVAEHLQALTPERARAVGEAARARVLAEHTYALRAAEVHALLESLTAQPRKAA